MNHQTRVISTAFGLAGFAVAVLAGLVAGNEPSTVLVRAILALFVCNLLGMAIGAVADVVIRDHVDRYMADNPIPEVPQPGRPSSFGVLDVEKKNG